MLQRFYRLCKIIAIIWQFRLFNLFETKITKPHWKYLVKLVNNKFSKRDSLPYNGGEALCNALENLGPIFIKFGQMLSTRSDMIPPDIAIALSRLQDNVPPFDSTLALQLIEKNLGKAIKNLFIEFNEVPIASASMAQVYLAKISVIDKATNTLSHKPVAVKVLRPNMLSIIEIDLSIMRALSFWLQKI